MMLYPYLLRRILLALEAGAPRVLASAARVSRATEAEKPGRMRIACATPLRAVPPTPPPAARRDRQAGCSGAALCPRALRARGPHVCRAQPEDVGAEGDAPSDLRLRIGVPKPRRATAAPTPVPVMHSSTYNLREDDAGGEEAEEIRSVAERPAVPAADNPVDTWLQSVDEGLSSFEERPPQAAKVFWNVANGPIGEAAGKGLRGAAKLTVAVGKEAVRVGAPAAGWAMKKGAKAAISLIAKSNEKKDKQPRKYSQPPRPAQDACTASQLSIHADPDYICRSQDTLSCLLQHGTDIGPVGPLRLRHDSPGVPSGWPLQAAAVFHAGTKQVYQLDATDANTPHAGKQELPWKRTLGGAS
eukprot:jgi/Tetstr1/446685/TSEL_003624.t1